MSRVVVSAFTDGACSGQHLPNPAARKGGSGVFIAPDPDGTGPCPKGLSLSKPYFPDEFDRQYKLTSQRCELLAAVLCLEWARDTQLSDALLNIYTDSRYVMVLFHGRNRTVPMNKDLVTRFLDLLDFFDSTASACLVRFIKTPAHRKGQAIPLVTDPEYKIWAGNHRADTLAKRAAKTPSN